MRWGTSAAAVVVGAAAVVAGGASVGRRRSSRSPRSSRGAARRSSAPRSSPARSRRRRRVVVVAARRRAPRQGQAGDDAGQHLRCHVNSSKRDGGQEVAASRPVRAAREPPLPRGSGCRAQGQATGLVRSPRRLHRCGSVPGSHRTSLGPATGDTVAAAPYTPPPWTSDPADVPTEDPRPDELRRAPSVVVRQHRRRQGQELGRVRRDGARPGPRLEGRRRAVRQERQVARRRGEARPRSSASTGSPSATASRGTRPTSTTTRRSPAAGWEQAGDLLAAGDHQLVVLDELTYLCTWGWLDTADVVVGDPRPARSTSTSSSPAGTPRRAGRGRRHRDRDARRSSTPTTRASAPCAASTTDDHVPARRGAEREERAGRGARPAPRRPGGVRRHLPGDRRRPRRAHRPPPRRAAGLADDRGAGRARRRAGEADDDGSSSSTA